MKKSDWVLIPTLTVYPDHCGRGRARQFRLADNPNENACRIPLTQEARELGSVRLWSKLTQNNFARDNEFNIHRQQTRTKSILLLAMQSQNSKTGLLFIVAEDSSPFHAKP